MSKKTSKSKTIATKTAKPPTKPAGRAKSANAAKDDGRCQVPRCRKPEAMTYLEHRICADHWAVLSGEDQAAADAIRSQLGLTTETKPAEAGQATDAPEAARADETTPPAADGAASAADATESPAPAKRARKAPKEAKPKRVSALDAAAQVLQAEGKPMPCQALIETMAAQGLWTSPGGKTPAATLYAAILREIKAKGGQARFRKVDRGQFASNAGGQA